MLSLGYFCVLCSILVLSVKVKLSVLLLCVCMYILPSKAIPKMIYTVSGETLNPTHTQTHSASSPLVSRPHLKTFLFCCSYLDLLN